MSNRQKVLQALNTHGPLTAQEVANHTGLTLVQAKQTIKDEGKLKWLESHGRCDVTRAPLYRITPSGRESLKPAGELPAETQAAIEQAEPRMNVIGQNGNTGEHYEAALADEVAPAKVKLNATGFICANTGTVLKEGDWVEILIDGTGYMRGTSIQLGELVAHPDPFWCYFKSNAGRASPGSFHPCMKGGEGVSWRKINPPARADQPSAEEVADAIFSRDRRITELEAHLRQHGDDLRAITAGVVTFCEWVGKHTGSRVPMNLTEARLALSGHQVAQLDETAKHPLQQIFDMAVDQVASGKGAERHGNGKPFLDQRWVHLADTYGVGFLFGQAGKKLEEAQAMDGDRRQREILGAINYAAMGLLYQAATTTTEGE